MLLILRLPAAEAIWLAELAESRGVNVFEVTATQPDYWDAFHQLRARWPNAEVGVGSLRTADEVVAAADAGADFAVSPVAVPDGAQNAQNAGMRFIEGASTPTEIHLAHKRGADLVKVFPAHALGGPSYIRAVLAPMPDLRLMPAGNVSTSEASAYLDAGATAVAIGSSIAEPEDLLKRDSAAVLARLDDLPLL